MPGMCETCGQATDPSVPEEAAESAVTGRPAGEPRQDADALAPYLRDQGEWAHFDEAAALADGLDPRLVRVGRAVNRMASGELAGEGQPELLPGFYGNWCGPGHSGPGEPVDQLDAACRDHDLCYGQGGYFNRECDLRLLRTIEDDFAGYTWAQKLYASAIYAVFALKTGVL